ncbi:nitroreductase family protein [Oscillospiraceae bacterium OttesenSCG-928-F05]|nr:nitroreductase family protein [Oscillospiraceae bacterium OttesenSCG-928-F05]
MNEVLKAIKERRSIRSYKAEPVAADALEKILEAGTYAASAMGKQSAVLISVSDSEMVRKLERLNAESTGRPDGKPFYGAPNVVVVLASLEDGKEIALKDGSLCMANLMLAAHTLGISSCWINRADKMFESDEGKALLKAWGIEGNYLGIGNCILGYTNETLPEPAPRKEHYIYRV